MPEPHQTYTLADPAVQHVLMRLYRDVRKERFRPESVSFGIRMFLNRLLRRAWSLDEYVQQTKTLYVPLSPERAMFAYLVARTIKASRIVEFGTSFGISTIYLAAAIKDNGGGIVIGSELDPTKVVTARANLEQAGLAEYVEIRQGDARETLANPGGTVDLLLNDGHKEFYLDLVHILTPYLRPGAVVLADNVTTGTRPSASTRDYITFMQNPTHGFTSLTIPFSEGMEYSVRL